jgi:hypothetical protein
MSVLSGKTSTRHCERSEAIQSRTLHEALDCFVADAPRNDGGAKP